MSDFKNTVDKCIYLSNNSQLELAKKIGVSQQFISKCKNNEFFPPKYFLKLIDVFPEKITLCELHEDFHKQKGV